MSPTELSKQSSPIGVFDSGVGGLSVLNAMRLTLPNENFIYFGDTANVPYGEKSAEDLTALTRRIVQWLVNEHRIKLLVVACNSSSGLVPGYIREFGDLHAINPIDPVAEYIRKHDWWDDVGVLATRRTVDSTIYPDKITAASGHVSVHQVACPGLVDLIEAGKSDTPECRDLAHGFARALNELCEDPEGVVLGCTHYPFVAQHIRTEFSPKTDLINPAGLMADAAYDWLSEHGLLNPAVPKGEVRYFVSGDAEGFQKTAGLLKLPYVGKIEASTLDPAGAVTHGS